jgi:hypothetical protein
MKRLSFLLAVLLVIGCSSTEQAHENEMTPLLTANTWKMSGEDLGTIKFNTDGTYVIEYESSIDLKTAGVWEWMSATEIVMTSSELIYDGQIEKMNRNPHDKDVIRITSLSTEKLTGIWRHFLDAEDSGFAREITYVAE